MALKSEDDIKKELEKALSRVLAREKMKTLILLRHIQELKNQKIELRAKIIYATKEAEAFFDNVESSDAPIASQITQISTEITELNNSCLNHRMVRDAFQRAAFNAQMQDAVYKKLESLDIKDSVKSSPEVRDLMEQHSSNLYTSQALLSVIEEKDKLEKNILKTRVKILDTMKNVKKKWGVLENKRNMPVVEEDDEIKGLKAKFRSRQLKVQIIVHVLQGLISASGINWGKEDFIVKLMLLCDIILNKGSKDSVEKMLEDLELAQKKMESKKRSAGESNLEKFVTGTPKTKTVKL